MVPLQATPEEFRALVGVGGRYRLEPVFSDGRSIKNSEPALIVLQEQPEEPARQQAGGGMDANDLILKLIEKHHESIDRTHELINEMASDHRKQVTALAEQNTALVTTLAENFGSYLSGSAELLRASHPPVPEPPRNALETLGEFKQIRELCADLSEDSTVAPDEVSPYADLVSEGVRSALPLLTQVIHKCVLGLSAEQTAALRGDPPETQTPTQTAPTSDPTTTTPTPENRKDPDFVAHLNAIEKHLTPKEVSAARGTLASMSPEHIAAWRAKLAALSPPRAADHVRAQLERQKAPP